MSRARCGPVPYALATILLTIAVSDRAAAAPKPFDFEKHLPGSPHMYLAGDAGKLLRAACESPLGALLTHPRVVEALGKVPAMIRAEIEHENRYFERQTQVEFLDAVACFDGRAVMVWPTVDYREGPSMIVALELGAHKKTAIEVAVKLARAEGNGQEPTVDTHRGHEITRWPVRYGQPISHAVIGDCLVFAGNGWEIEDVIDRYHGAKKDSLGADARYLRARQRCRVGGREPLATFYFDFERFQEVMLEGMRQRSSSRTEESFNAGMVASGFKTVSTMMYQLGFDDGDFEGRLVVESPNGHSGTIGLIAQLAQAPSSLQGLEHVPANASQIACTSVYLGKVLRDLAALVVETEAEMESDVQGFIRGVEKALEISVSREVYTLPRIDAFTFVRTPPAGSLVPDVLSVCRRSQAQPYLAFLEKVAGGGKKRTVDALGTEVAWLRVGGLGRFLNLGSPPRSTSRSFEDIVESALTDPALGIAWAPIDADWVVIGMTPQSVGRYFAFYAEEEKASENDALRELVHGRIGKGSAFALLRGGGSVLAGYNSAVSLLSAVEPSLAPVLGEYGIRPSRLPAGELFAPAFRDGFLRVEAREKTLTIHGHRAATNTAITVGLPLVALAALPMVSTRQRVHIAHEHSHGEAVVASTPMDEDPATQRLRKIGELLKQHMEKSGSRAYPHSPDGKAAGFQKLVDSGVLTDASVLVHPFSSDRPAGRGEDGKPRITEKNSSYFLVPWRQGPSDVKTRILCYEKQAFQRGGRHVLHVGLGVKFHTEREFQALLAKQLKRYGKKKAATERKGADQ